MKPPRLSVIAILILLVGCGESSDARYDSGYDDGYAAGYNTTCEIRATLVEGDWKDEDYASGYRDGYSDGAVDCNKKRE